MSGTETRKMRPLTPKQNWVLEYLKEVTCASEHELAKNYEGLKKPTQDGAFNMAKTLESLIQRGLVVMERNPISRFRYYSLI